MCVPLQFLVEAAAEKGGCLNVLLLTAALVFFGLAEHLEAVLHVFACAAILKDGFASSLDFLSCDLKAIPVFELCNAEIAALFFHYFHLLS